MESLKTWDFVGLRERQWVEIPRFEELQCGSWWGEWTFPLQKALDTYHQTPKTVASELTARRQQLEALTLSWEKLSWPDGLDRWALWLLKRFRGKAAFLSALEQIFKEGWHESAALSSYHRPAPSSEAVRSLSLTQHRYVCPERGSFWGDYWMQTLDPCHRYLPDLHRHWEDMSRTGTQLPPYLLWLEQYSGTEAAPFFYYFSDAEQGASRILVQDGQLCQVSGRPLHCSERQHYLFVIDLDRQIYAQREAPHLCHASFTRGRPVLASGVFQVREGRLFHLKFESGHYLSGLDDWKQALQLFHEAGVRWPEGARLTLHDRYRFISRRISHDIFASSEQLSTYMGLSRS